MKHRNKAGNKPRQNKFEGNNLVKERVDTRADKFNNSSPVHQTRNKKNKLKKHTEKLNDMAKEEKATNFLNEDVRKGGIDFTFKLSSFIYKSGENFVMSPFSLISALTMVLAGSHDKTRSELLDVMFSSKTKHQDEEFNKLLDHLAEFQTHFFQSNNSVFRNANFLYSHVDFPLKTEYNELLAKKFSALAKQLDFTRAAETLEVINGDVKKSTDGMIEKLVESISSDIKVILVNAIHFKGLWKNPFEKESVSNQNFHLSNGSTIEVAMMFQNKSFPCCFDTELKVKAIRLSYSEGSISMVILLPEEGQTVKDVLAILNDQKINQVLTKMRSQEVDLSLPKFKLESTHSTLVQHLGNLGIQTLFDQRANLSGISKEPLSVSDIIQKAVIEVDEEGTKAAAATAIMLRAMCLRENFIFNANRPFIFLLIPSDNSIVLFCGVVENPTAI